MSCRSQEQPNHCAQTTKEIFPTFLQEVHKENREKNTENNDFAFSHQQMMRVGLWDNGVHQAAAQSQSSGKWVQQHITGLSHPGKI